jgi:hypothetical protein
LSRSSDGSLNKYGGVFGSDAKSIHLYPQRRINILIIRCYDQFKFMKHGERLETYEWEGGYALGRPNNSVHLTCCILILNAIGAVITWTPLRDLDSEAGCLYEVSIKFPVFPLDGILSI